MGAGLLIQPSGQWVLKQLSLLGAASHFGADVQRLYGDTVCERPLMELHYRDLYEGCFGLGMHRGTLFQLLYNAAQNENIRFRLGQSVDDLTSLSSFDLVVIADGSRSKLRAKTGIPFKAKRYPWGALWGITPQQNLTDANTLAQRYDNTDFMLGMLPTGQHIDQPGTELNSFFWSLPTNHGEVWHVWGIQRWKDLVASKWPAIEPMLEHFKSKQDVRFAEYFDINMPYWHKDNVVVIGDAAHGTSPQLGQGANMALVDAWVLRQSLISSQNSSTAAAEYSVRRKKHLGYYQTASRWLTPLYQAKRSPVGWGRDIGMPIGNKLPFVYRNMLETLVGIKTGLFSATDLQLQDPFK